MTVLPGPVIEHCPNCGAPLDLVAGSCRWCGQHVTMPAPAPRVDDDGDEDEDEDDVADEIHDRIGVGDVDTGLPVPVSWILSTLSWLTYDPAVQAFLERDPDLLELARRHTAAVTAAGERLRDAGVDDDEISRERIGSVYSADEMWTLDLGTDLIAWLAAVDGIDEDMQTGAGSGIWGNDAVWKDEYAKPLKKAGDGPAGLRELRARVPRRGRYNANGRKLPDPTQPSGHNPSRHWRK
jgi:hypothetical protein